MKTLYSTAGFVLCLCLATEAFRIPSSQLNTQFGYRRLNSNTGGSPASPTEQNAPTPGKASSQFTKPNRNTVDQSATLVSPLGSKVNSAQPDIYVPSYKTRQSPQPQIIFVDSQPGYGRKQGLSYKYAQQNLGYNQQLPYDNLNNIIYIKEDYPVPRSSQNAQRLQFDLQQGLPMSSVKQAGFSDIQGLYPSATDLLNSQGAPLMNIGALAPVHTLIINPHSTAQSTVGNPAQIGNLALSTLNAPARNQVQAASRASAATTYQAANQAQGETQILSANQNPSTSQAQSANQAKAAYQAKQAAPPPASTSVDAPAPAPAPARPVDSFENLVNQHFLAELDLPPTSATVNTRANHPGSLTSTKSTSHSSFANLMNRHFLAELDLPPKVAASYGHGNQRGPSIFKSPLFTGSSTATAGSSLMDPYFRMQLLEALDLPVPAASTSHAHGAAGPTKSGSTGTTSAAAAAPASPQNPDPYASSSSRSSAATRPLDRAFAMSMAEALDLPPTYMRLM